MESGESFSLFHIENLGTSTRPYCDSKAAELAKMTEEQRQAHIQQQISTLRRRKARKAVEKKILDQHEDMNIIMKNFLKKSKSSNSVPSRSTTFKSTG